MANVGPLAQGGLDEAFRLAVGARSVRTGEAVLDAELEAGGAEVAGAIAASVVGEQAADGDAMLGVEGDSGVQEGNGGFALLVGEDAGEGEAGVIVDGDVQGPASRRTGAQRGRILRMILGSGISLAGVGLAIGAAGAFFMSRLMSGLLLDVNPRDPQVFLGIAAALIVATLVASWLPARRATRVDPMEALRYE